MPIKISDSLPARAVLESENIFVMTERRAAAQDIRPLRLVILNLMPTKAVTETQLLRSLSNTPLQIEVELLQTSTYSPKNTAGDHLLAFYTTFDKIRDNRYDGMIITGAPVETMEFEDVAYWPELCDILSWSDTHVQSTFHICWGAQAALYYHYGVKKYPLAEKMLGIFEHRVYGKAVELVRGFDDLFLAPHSRHTEVRAEDLDRVGDVRVLAASDRAGVYLAIGRGGRRVFVIGHGEYDADTLALEYFRDKDKGMDIALPYNYFPNDDPAQKPRKTWRSHGHLLYSNWLNYYVYQATPYDIGTVGT
ncbi:MAG: homoserine O-succinyltransferase [Oscillospiraceae bacterium]|nr:homoserine O-succinyltransferase [Oscillospiraceae bacterium]